MKFLCAFCELFSSVFFAGYCLPCFLVMDIVGAVIICTLLLAFSIALFFMSLTKTEVTIQFFFLYDDNFSLELE